MTEEADLAAAIKKDPRKAIAAETHIVTMGRLRERLIVLMGSGAIVGAGNKDFLNAVLNGILKDIEDERIKHEKAAAKLQRQIGSHEAQAEGCRMMRALVYNVVDKFAVAAESDARIDAELARVESDALAEDEPEEPEASEEGDEEEVEYEEVEVEEEEEEAAEEPPAPVPEPPKKTPPSRRSRRKGKKPTT